MLNPQYFNSQKKLRCNDEKLSCYLLLLAFIVISCKKLVLRNAVIKFLIFYFILNFMLELLDMQCSFEELLTLICLYILNVWVCWWEKWSWILVLFFPSSPLKVKEDDEVDNLDIKLDRKRKSKRVYQSPPPEVGLKISRSLKVSWLPQTCLTYNEMNEFHIAFERQTKLLFMRTCN